MSDKLLCAIFDLDGTLFDTSPGIMESADYAAEKLGYTSLTQSQLSRFIGPPLRSAFIECYRCSEDEAEELTKAYREHYRAGALLNVIPYEGIMEVCQQLKDEGMLLAVATSKPQLFSEQILKHYGFDQYFSIVHGADMGERLKKSDMIRQCMVDAGTKQCVMIGDTLFDAKGAQEAGVPFLAVSYGFGDRNQMLQYPNIGVADQPMEILEIIKKA